MNNPMPLRQHHRLTVSRQDLEWYLMTDQVKNPRRGGRRVSKCNLAKSRLANFLAVHFRIILFKMNDVQRHINQLITSHILLGLFIQISHGHRTI